MGYNTVTNELVTLYAARLEKNGWAIRYNKGRSTTEDLFKASKNNMAVYCGTTNSAICHFNIIGNTDTVNLLDHELLYVGYGKQYLKEYEYIIESLEDFIVILENTDTYENLIMWLEQNVLENMLKNL